MAHSLGMRAGILPRQTSRAIPIYGSSTIFSNNRQSQCRAFSQTKPTAAKGGMMSGEMIVPKQPPQPSMISRMRDIDPDKVPTDFGILPGTFIKPEGKDMPDFFKHPKERLMFEWTWLKSWVTSAFATIYFCKWQCNPRASLLLKERKQIGKGLHTLMYTEFAKGNERMIRAKCSPGLGNDLIKRIRKRNPKETISWTLERYIRDPSTFFTGVRVLSDRATLIPEVPDSAIRQIVLRIKSQQSSLKISKEGTDNLEQAVFSVPKVQDCTEYVVIQKVRIAGKEKDWEIWGFAKPTTLEDLDSPFFAAGLSLKERVLALQDRFTGRS
ncbi:hypothetical protein TCE0_060f18840 [Talaromyces pinophilus]|uniref:Tim44-like domain-containing protein n=1 Tax=Talaromyces pinophilus TaxID=128442 RepID=A0A6V8HQ08_TALPI|nr:hypothetical protein DPV78_007925 [Talaromyces pinophilus]PCH00730.1 Hypothetical protein PENO1_046720 [Penicillium occitanis (nom. inval.)]PCH02938.1 hypothetical protein PENOC_041190 [Penicillium occitanis (nom. inval.)]GAM43763.1 hypothetical protein TCE0_060f18840 [Talaromyces pinophilus]